MIVDAQSSSLAGVSGGLSPRKAAEEEAGSLFARQLFPEVVRPLLVDLVLDDLVLSVFREELVVPGSSLTAPQGGAEWSVCLQIFPTS